MEKLECVEPENCILIKPKRAKKAERTNEAGDEHLLYYCTVQADMKRLAEQLAMSDSTAPAFGPFSKHGG